jgi:hypothetical protein
MGLAIYGTAQAAYIDPNTGMLFSWAVQSALSRCSIVILESDKENITALSVPCVARSLT